MLRLTKFVFGCFVLGALLLAGANLLDSATATGSPAASRGFLHTATAQANGLVRQGVAQLPFSSSSAGAFFSHNANTARLQLDSMKSTIASMAGSVRAWLPGSGSRVIQSGVQQAASLTGDKTNALARKMPAVTAVKSDIDRLAAAHPMLNSASVGF